MTTALFAAALSVSTALLPQESPRLVIAGSASFGNQSVPNADVYAAWFDGDAWAYQLAKTDDRGRFAVRWPQDPVGSISPAFLLVRDAHGRLGWFDLRGPWPDWVESALRVELSEVAETHGRILDAAGVPIRQARVRASGFSSDSDERKSYWRVPWPLRELWTTTTDDDGRFTLKSVPRDCEVHAELAAGGFGACSLKWRREVSCDVRLPKPGSIRVRFEGAPDAAGLNTLKLHLYGRATEGIRGPVTLTSSIQGMPVSDALLEIAPALPGRYTLSVHRDSRSPYLAETPTEFVVASSGTTEITVRVSPAAEVRGRVVDSRTRQGIARVPVCVSRPGEHGRRWVTGHTKTDADGRFRAFAEPDDLGVMISGTMSGAPIPRGYCPPPEHAKTPTSVVKAGESHTFPDLELEPAVIVPGVVVDAAGKPLPGITIRTAHDLSFSLNALVISDEAGRFALTDLALGEATALRARSATATTNGAVSLTVRERNEPIRLVLSEANAFRVCGRVVDPDGRPIVGARGRVEWRYGGVGRAERWGIGSWGGIVFSDADGRFASRALVPDDEYRLVFDAPGFGKAETTLVRGVAGTMHDFGRMTLPRSSGTISGMVVDARIRPIEGARVLNSGDGPKPLSTTTDSGGRFELSGLFEGPIYLCAHKPGCRFTGARAKSGDRDITMTLLAADDPPPQSQPNPRPPEYVAAQKKLLRHLLDRLWALPDETLGTSRARVLECMARFDLGQAHRWFDERKRGGAGDTGEGSALATALMIADAESAAAADADEAIGLLANLRPDKSARVLLTIAQRLKSSDPRRALRIVEEAVVKARAVPLPDRAGMLAEVGELLVQVGERDAGRALILEAADQAQQLGGLPRDGFVRGMVAARLAVFDLDRAKALIPLQPESENHRWLAAVAVRIAPENLDHALRIVSGFEPNSSLKPDTQGRIARRLAEAGKTAEAVQLAQSIENPYTPLSAVAAVAEIVARSDPAQARRLIDETLDRYLNDSDRLLPFSRSPRPLYMAAIARHALQARHPDLDSVVARIMACRLTNQSDSPDRVATETAKLANLLALVDPSSAKGLLDRTIPVAAAPREADARFNERDWLLAVAFADPARAIKVVDHAIAAVKSSAKDAQLSNLIVLAIVLAEPSEDERLRELAIYGSFHWPRDDD